MSEKLGIEIIAELDEIRFKLGYGLETDDEIIHNIAQIKTSLLSQEDLWELRLSMWLDYTWSLLESVEDKISELMRNFANVDKVYNQLNIFKRKYSALNDKAEMRKRGYEDNLKAIRLLFSEIHELSKEIDDNKKIMMDKGKKTFWKSYYSWIAPLTAGVYGVFLYIKYTSIEAFLTSIFGHNLFTAPIIVLVLIIILYAMYRIAKHIIPIQVKKSKDYYDERD